MRLIFFLKIFACGSDPFSFTLRCVHVEIAMLSCGNYTVLSSVLVYFFSESAKGSDSEDDFLRQKTKAKVASDSDSDSDIGRKKRKKYIFTHS